MKTFAISDIHGQYNALKDCFEQCGIDYDEDKLIIVGDLCDRGNKVRECVDEVMKIKNLVYIIGNHEEWVFNDEYKDLKEELVDNFCFGQEHMDFFDKAKPYYLDEENRLFVHGGIDPGRSIEEQDLHFMVWDRGFAVDTLEKIQADRLYWIPGYKEVYVGHTPTINFEIHGKKMIKPIILSNFIMLDTGAGWGERLSILDIDTKQFWYSDKSKQ